MATGLGASSRGRRCRCCGLPSGGHQVEVELRLRGTGKTRLACPASRVRTGGLAPTLALLTPNLTPTRRDGDGLAWTRTRHGGLISGGNLSVAATARASTARPAPKAQPATSAVSTVGGPDAEPHPLGVRDSVGRCLRRGGRFARPSPAGLRTRLRVGCVALGLRRPPSRQPLQASTTHPPSPRISAVISYSEP